VPPSASNSPPKRVPFDFRWFDRFRGGRRPPGSRTSRVRKLIARRRGWIRSVSTISPNSRVIMPKLPLFLLNARLNHPVSAGQIEMQLRACLSCQSIDREPLRSPIPLTEWVQRMISASKRAALPANSISGIWRNRFERCSESNTRCVPQVRRCKPEDDCAPALRFSYHRHAGLPAQREDILKYPFVNRLQMSGIKAADDRLLSSW
jgi:hypothetical protein